MSPLAQPAGGNMLAWLPSAPPRRTRLCPGGSHLVAPGAAPGSEQGCQGHCVAWGRCPPRGPVRTSWWVAQTRSKTASSPSYLWRIYPDPGSALTWISEQCRHAGHVPQVPSLSLTRPTKGAGRLSGQSSEGTSWISRMNRDSCIIQMPTWASPPRFPETS